MLTFQDFIKETEGKSVDALTSFISKAINEHQSDQMVKIARSADNYDNQQNETITKMIKFLYLSNGSKVEDTTVSNHKLASGFFHRLNVQRNTYLLGNGVDFDDKSVKDKLGDQFDQIFKSAGYNALIHGLTFVYWNHDRIYNFDIKEFKPFWDEDTGALRAGIRFWRLSDNKPLKAILYEEDGYTKFSEDKDKNLVITQPKRRYITKVRINELDGIEIVGEDNYSFLPVIPFWGSRNHMSTLVKLRSNIDAYDMIKSGFANDLDECAQIYWLINGANGMDDIDLQEFRDRIKLNHVAKVERDGQVVPYTQEVPSGSRETLLNRIKSDLYEDFGALDVHTIAAGATNDHIDAAYQPLDEEADDYEFQCTDCIKQILALQGITAEPVYKRNRISNQMEQVQMLIMEAPYLDEETILAKLPNVTIDEVNEIIKRKTAEDLDRFSGDLEQDEEESTGEEEVAQTA